MISLLFLPCFFLFKDNPPTPPCYAASVKKTEFKEAILILVKMKDYIIIVIGFTFFYGNFNILVVFLPYIISPFGYNDPI